MKTFLAAFATAMMLLGPAGITSSQAQAAQMYMSRSYGHVHANGRCHGISYGTGARRCGTASGGPVGGLSSRN